MSTQTRRVKSSLSLLIKPFIVLIIFTLNLFAASSVSIGDATISEGNSGTQILQFTVNSSGNTKDTTVDYNITNGTASSGSDYIHKSGEISFTANNSNEIIEITINGDTTVERDENLSVSLSNFSGDTISDNSGIGILTNDDYIPSSISVPENTTTVIKLEGEGSFTIIGGDDSSKFSITPSGLLTFNTPPDYEHPSDSNTDYSYEIEIQLEDSLGIVATQNMIVTITNLNSDLTISKDSPDTVLIGSNFTYTLSIENLGPDKAESINVVDNLPAGISYNGVIASDWTCSFNAGSLNCNYDLNLSSGSTSSIIIDVIAPGIDNNVTNEARISSYTDSNFTNNTAYKTTTIMSNATDLSIDMSSNPNPDVTKTSTLTYTINVTNLGPNISSGIQFINPFPNDLNFISIDDGDSGNSWSCSTGSEIICDYIKDGGILSINDTASTVTIETRAPNIITTIDSNVTVFGKERDTNSANNIARTSTNIIDGMITRGEEAFTKYLQYNISGDVIMINNANLNKPDGASDNNYNDNIDTHINKLLFYQSVHLVHLRLYI